jgi:hypothetical protein
LTEANWTLPVGDGALLHPEHLEPMKVSGTFGQPVITLLNRGGISRGRCING